MKKKYALLIAVMALLISTTGFADVTSSSDSGATAGAFAGSGNSKSETTFNQSGSNVPRGFVFPSTNNFVGAPNDFGNGQQYWNFVPSTGMIAYTPTYKASDLAKIVKAKNVKLNLRFWANGAATSEITFGVGPAKFVNSDKKEITMEQVGMGTIRVEKGKEDSFELLAQVGLEGTKRGATHVLFIGEGAQSFMDVSAWGVALGYTHAYINTESASQSGAGTAGVGYTKGTAERKGNPFLQVLFLKALPMPVVIVQKIEPAPAPVINPCANPTKVSVKFELGKDAIESGQNAVIKEMAAWLKGTKCLSIVKGGASKEKGQTYNAGLGLRRAENVRNALMKEGIERGQIVLAVSSGKDFPSSTDGKENREVDIITIVGMGVAPIAK